MVLLALTALSCARTYVPRRYALLDTPAVDAVVVRLRLGSLPSHELELELELESPGQTKLWNARFALDPELPCGAGVTSSELELDGRLVRLPPAEIGGRHTLRVSFGGQPDTSSVAIDRLRQSAWHPAHVELDVEDAAGARSCVRFPVLGGERAPDWQMAEGSAGLFIAVGGRVHPVGIARDDAIDPSGAFVERIGAVFGPHRLWGEFAAFGSGEASSYHLFGGVGADRVFAESGPWAARAGFSYGAVFNFRQLDDEQREHRYTLHGPQVSLGVSYLFLRNLLLPFNATHPELGTGQRTFGVELEVPMALWFGTGDAPFATFVPGLGLNLFWAL